MRFANAFSDDSTISTAGAGFVALSVLAARLSFNQPWQISESCFNRCQLISMASFLEHRQHAPLRWPCTGPRPTVHGIFHQELVLQRIAQHIRHVQICAIEKTSLTYSTSNHIRNYVQTTETAGMNSGHAELVPFFEQTSTIGSWDHVSTSKLRSSSSDIKLACLGASPMGPWAHNVFGQFWTEIESILTKKKIV